MEELTLKMENTQGNVNIRTGQALPLREPQKIAISGDINTVRVFAQKRLVSQELAGLQAVLTDKSVIYTDKAKREIKLAIDPENYYGATVTGTLELTDDLKGFDINSQSLMNREKLVKLLKFSKRFFDSPEVHLNVLTAYSAFKATSTTQHENSNDQRGNKTVVMDKKVNSNLPESFVLNMPIFKGMPNERFMVEVCLEVTDAGAHFWFESPELVELIAKRTDEIFTDQLKDIGDIVIINV